MADCHIDERCSLFLFKAELLSILLETVEKAREILKNIAFMKY